MKQFRSRQPSRPVYASGTRYESGNKIATIKYIPGGLMLEVEFPYSQAILDDFNSSILAKKRVWNPQSKVWYIAKDQFDKISHILGQHCDEVLLIDFPKIETDNSNWTKLYLIEGAPHEVIQATYRALCKLNHPDHGGDVERMKDINLAYKALMGELANGD